MEDCSSRHSFTCVCVQTDKGGQILFIHFDSSVNPFEGSFSVVLVPQVLIVVRRLFLFVELKIVPENGDFDGKTLVGQYRIRGIGIVRSRIWQCWDFVSICQGPFFEPEVVCFVDQNSHKGDVAMSLDWYTAHIILVFFG